MPHRRGELLHRLAQIHGFEYASPGEDAIRLSLEQAGRSAEWDGRARYEIKQKGGSGRQRNVCPFDHNNGRCGELFFDAYRRQNATSE